MRKSATSPVLRARAIAGTYVVVLAWDFQPGQEQKRNGLMGFAIERAELVDGRIDERYWMRSIKRFRDKDRGLPAGTPVSTADHPIQSFQWGDYTAQAGRSYRYRIVPTYGPAKNLMLDERSAVDGRRDDRGRVPAAPASRQRHGAPRVYFNRGVIGSQAYARRFENAEPDPAQSAVARR